LHVRASQEFGLNPYEGIGTMRAMWTAAIGLIAVVAASSQIYAGRPNVPSPLFAGKEIPEPPQQRQAWRAPADKVPDKLVKLNEELFKLGFADLRVHRQRSLTARVMIPGSNG
jgi:hypothetical protein